MVRLNGAVWIYFIVSHSINFIIHNIGVLSRRMHGTKVIVDFAYMFELVYTHAVCSVNIWINSLCCVCVCQSAFHCMFVWLLHHMNHLFNSENLNHFKGHVSCHESACTLHTHIHIHTSCELFSWFMPCID